MWGFLLEFLQAYDLASNNDTVLLVVIPATSCRDVAASRALKLAQELDSDGELKSGFYSELMRKHASS